MNLSPEKLARYRETARYRQEQAQPEVARLREEAWAAARRAAEILRAQFAANRVVVFGSLTSASSFNRWSDIDMAAWGIAPEDTLRAMGVLLDSDTGFAINLVDINTCRPSLRKVIEQQGFDL
jgi:predicted nucleotidyltransferase